MSFEEKVKRLNLLLITQTLLYYILEIDPEFAILDDEKHMDYVKFYHGKPYYYSKKYLETTPYHILLSGFVDIVKVERS